MKKQIRIRIPIHAFIVMGICVHIACVDTFSAVLLGEPARRLVWIWLEIRMVCVDMAGDTYGVCGYGWRYVWCVRIWLEIRMVCADIAGDTYGVCVDIDGDTYGVCGYGWRYVWCVTVCGYRWGYVWCVWI